MISDWLERLEVCTVAIPQECVFLGPTHHLGTQSVQMCEEYERGALRSGSVLRQPRDLQISSAMDILPTGKPFCVPRARSLLFSDALIILTVPEYVLSVASIPTINAVCHKK